MKVILEFDATEDLHEKVEAKRALSADDAFMLISDIRDLIRSHEKHGEPDKEDAVNRIRDLIDESCLLQYWN